MPLPFPIQNHNVSQEDVHCGFRLDWDMHGPQQEQTLLNAPAVNHLHTKDTLPTTTRNTPLRLEWRKREVTESEKSPGFSEETPAT